MKDVSSELKEMFRKLMEPFSYQDIEVRIGNTNREKTKGVAFYYVTNRAIMNRLDEIFTPFGWKNEYKDWQGGSQLCGISIRVPDENGNGEWLTKWDGAENTTFEAVKGGLSDAMKRAAVQWGIGRYLYALDEVWVDVEQRGQSTYIKKDQYYKLQKNYEDHVTVLTGKKPQSAPPAPPTKESSVSAEAKKPQVNSPAGKETEDNKPMSEKQLNWLLKEKELLGLTEEEVRGKTLSEAKELIKKLVKLQEAKKEQKSSPSQNVKQPESSAAEKPFCALTQSNYLEMLVKSLISKTTKSKEQIIATLKGKYEVREIEGGLISVPLAVFNEVVADLKSVDFVK